MSQMGQDRRIDDVRDVSGVPPIASELARRSNNGPGQEETFAPERIPLHFGRQVHRLKLRAMTG
jgi:hypothetical protein